MQIFQQPYPYFFQKKRILKIAGYIFTIVFIFLLVFRPFNIDETEHRFPYVITALIQVISSTLIFVIAIRGFNYLINDKVEENWTVLKEIGLLSFVFLCIGIGNFFVRNIIYNNANNLSWHYLIEELTHTFLIGVFITIIYTLTNTERLTRLHKKFAAQVTTKPKEKPRTETIILIETKNETESFALSTHQFLFAKAEGNYVEFYLSEEEKLQKKLCRITLTQLEEQLKYVPAIVRTHRAYLVNTDHIQKIEGNAQGLKLSIKVTPEIIPVSRGQIPAFRHVMNG
jgi:hypothetical protein